MAPLGNFKGTLFKSGRGAVDTYKNRGGAYFIVLLDGVDEDDLAHRHIGLAAGRDHYDRRCRRHEDDLLPTLVGHRDLFCPAGSAGA